MEWGSNTNAGFASSGLYTFFNQLPYLKKTMHIRISAIVASQLSSIDVLQKITYVGFFECFSSLKGF